MSTRFSSQRASRVPPIDRFGRRISYARLSVTDRCDFRCIYCMAEDMHFLPRQAILSLEELLLVGRSLVASGIHKLRLTGGEPLIRKNILWLVEALSRIDGLQELTLTTNGSQLEKYAQDLKRCGVKRINISLDSLDAKKFKSLTRTGNLDLVLRGIDAAIEAGFEAIKINSVILKNHNDDEILNLLDFVRRKNIDITFIEEMPLGSINEREQRGGFFSTDEVRLLIEKEFKLLACEKKTNGPARYFTLHDSNSYVGFISPHSHNFCGDCNRVRVTAEGRLLLCLGNEHSVDLRALIREQGATVNLLAKTIEESMSIKPERHYFNQDDAPEIVRFMNMTGG